MKTTKGRFTSEFWASHVVKVCEIVCKLILSITSRWNGSVGEPVEGEGVPGEHGLPEPQEGEHIVHEGEVEGDRLSLVHAPQGLHS